MMLARNFDMWYVDQDGEKKHPYIIHCGVFGCYERMMALILEKYAGALPLWISPTQVKIMSLTDRTSDDAKKLALEQGIRCEVDVRNEKIGYKIREAQLEKVPYMIILGDKEKENEVVAVRSRNAGDLGTMTEKEFVDKLTKEITEKVC